jgi:preprotein translocase subunit SecA
MSLLKYTFRLLFGSRNERLLKQLSKTVEQINSFAAAWERLSDAALQGKTAEFRERLSTGCTVEMLIPEAFATVREASRRVLGMVHFDVQLLGGLVLHSGRIAEMCTGEGKTLVATLPAYLNALTGQGVHIVTVNDYLANRDAAWMGPLYDFLGLNVGVIKAGMSFLARQAAYRADITYGTNNEFGFDYLRDNMASHSKEQVQRGQIYAIVDEVDSILIDESRTPLIISGPREESTDYYVQINEIVAQLQPGLQSSKAVPRLRLLEAVQSPDQAVQGDFIVDEKARQVTLTEKGLQRLEDLMLKSGLLGVKDMLYDAKHISLMYYVSAALRAKHIYRRDVDYIVQHEQVVIVDEHTGRLMPGRRWSEGLHQAIEAKEGVPIQAENQTLASITFQNYFRLYQKLAGMTGTADTEAYEFHQIYGLEVVVIPTHKPVCRKNLPDKIYLTVAEKFDAIVADIVDCRKQGQPVLVGTASIKNSEALSRLLQKKKIPHQVLNAKLHEQEARIIAEAGRPATVTVATNMAGRGTDIIPGGDLKAELAALPNTATEAEVMQHKAAFEQRCRSVTEANGPYALGSERHESRRIDNQFRGRVGRQGGPGVSRFYLSLEDDLLRIFGADRVTHLMQRLGMQPGEAIEHPWITRAIENAQRKVEAHHFDIRKQLLEYDDVINEQRKVIYELRQNLLTAGAIDTLLKPIWQDVLTALIARYIPIHAPEEYWEISNLTTQLREEFGFDVPIEEWFRSSQADEVSLRDRLLTHALAATAEKEKIIGATALRAIEKNLMLQTLDRLWKDHLAMVEHLKQGIHLRGFAQRNPKQEYKRESFELFTHLLENLKYQTISLLSNLPIQQAANQVLFTPDLAQPPVLQQIPHAVGRNQTCPCGSGKKFKYCHGRFN